MVELSAAEDRRQAVLERNGLDEDAWDAIDRTWQDRLSEAMNQDDDEVPEILTRYTKAYEEAQRALGPVMSLETLARVTQLLSATSDLRAALAKSGVTLAD